MKKLLYILSWIPVILLKIFLILLGLIAVPFALIGRTQKHFKHHGRYFAKMWWLWDNKEEGCPEWWLKIAPDKNFIAKAFPRWWWFAIRNPVNGFRYIFEDRDPKYITNWNMDRPMEAMELIESAQNMAYRWAYNGAFAGYRRVWLTKPGKYSEVWFGWKIGSTVPGMGFTSQIRLNRDIGT